MTKLHGVTGQGTAQFMDCRFLVRKLAPVSTCPILFLAHTMHREGIDLIMGWVALLNCALYLQSFSNLPIIHQWLENFRRNSFPIPPSTVSAVRSWSTMGRAMVSFDWLQSAAPRLDRVRALHATSGRFSLVTYYFWISKKTLHTICFKFSEGYRGALSNYDSSAIEDRLGVGFLTEMEIQLHIYALKLSFESSALLIFEEHTLPSLVRPA